ncbi:hypothetical protein [Paenibacillus sp. FJAT-26967]|uniref:hypothetical protein n=1 Tax=Paenibacillus sp. FJAT-26967 TaxID=1729690 RepID=UPI0008388AB7|nr:hypothetical protein [Paenibacillus sp. FJAT-26967]
MSALLLHELKKFVERATDHLQFGEPAKKVNIHLGWLPIKEAPKGEISPSKPPRIPDSEFPYVIIRVMDGEDRMESGSVQVKFLLGVKSQDGNAYMDILHLKETIRQALLRTEIVGDKFELQRPLKWTLFEEQPYPEWFGEIITTWTVPTVLREVRYE